MRSSRRGESFALNAYSEDEQTREEEESVVDLAVEATERVEGELDAFINKRSKSKQHANDEEALWKASTRRANERRRAVNRWLWIRHHDHMNRLHLELAGEHADRRSRLLAEGGYELDDSPSPPEAA